MDQAVTGHPRTYAPPFPTQTITKRSIWEGVSTEDSGRSALLLPRRMLGPVAECWEGRLGFIVLSLREKSWWGETATFHQADPVTSGLWVLKPWLPHLTSFCHLFPCF